MFLTLSKLISETPVFASIYFDNTLVGTHPMVLVVLSYLYTLATKLRKLRRHFHTNSLIRQLRLLDVTITGHNTAINFT